MDSLCSSPGPEEDMSSVECQEINWFVTSRIDSPSLTQTVPAFQLAHHINKLDIPSKPVSS